MRSCSNCKRSNDVSMKYCPGCGNWLGNSPIKSRKSFFSRIPSWLTAVIVLLAAFAFIGLNILFVVGISSFEGFASMIFLTIGTLMFVVFALKRRVTTASGRPITGALVIFFAFMGAVIDQPGNFAYNKPLEWTSCPDGSSLDRKMDIFHVHPGKTMYSQDFTCYDAQGNAVKQISMFWVIFIRFLEYIVLGILLVFVRRLIQEWRENRANTP